MLNNGIFNTNYSTSNPFGISGTNQSLDASIIEAYNKLEALKNQQNQQYNTVNRTVFTDITEEFKDLSADESTFIVSSKEYQDAFNKYQTEFSEFLTAKFSTEFLQTNGGRSAEELLYTIKKQKDQYKTKFANDINEIRDQNRELINKNDQLASNNAELQKQLKEIQNMLWKENRL
jgi:gas vesicle protein